MFTYKIKIKKVSGRLNESILPSKNLLIKSKKSLSKKAILKEANAYFKKRYGLVVESISVVYPSSEDIKNMIIIEVEKLVNRGELDTYVDEYFNHDAYSQTDERYYTSDEVAEYADVAYLDYFKTMMNDMMDVAKRSQHIVDELPEEAPDYIYREMKKVSPSNYEFSFMKKLYKRLRLDGEKLKNVSDGEAYSIMFELLPKVLG